MAKKGTYQRKSKQGYFIIGGSPSTGSSLLRQILQRHSQIYCLPETHLLAKKKLYADWDNEKDAILKKSWSGLRTEGFHPFSGMDIDDSISNDQIKEYIKESKNVKEFFGKIAKELSGKKRVKLFGEKTPHNANCFKEYLKLFRNGKAIHIVRNPYDAMASMLFRGKSIVEAVELYMYNTVNGLASRGNDRYMEVRYEDLVTNPEKTVALMCSFLGIRYEDQKLSPSEVPNEITKIKGWKNDESHAISKSSLHRFDELDKDIQLNLAYLCTKIEITTIGANLKSICDVLGYKYRHCPIDIDMNIQNMLRMRKLKLHFSRSNFNLFNYPIAIESEQIPD